ncbi:tyrosine-type recombinase/integrase [Candidatus Margulisiibacteriota bacterium]
MLISKAIPIFLGHLKNLAYAKRTINEYDLTLKRFYKFLSNINVLLISDINSRHISDFKDILSKRNISKYTLHRYLGDIRLFFDFLLKEEIISANPCLKIINHRRLRSIKLFDFLSEQEVSRLLSLPDTNTLLGLRDRTILEILYGSGLRHSELINLKKADFNFRKKELYIHLGKGKKDRLVPITSQTKLFLSKYLKVLSALDIRQDILWINQSGKKLTRSLNRIIAKYCRMAAIKKNISAHSFRRSLATHLFRKGAPLIHVQKLLGHNSIETTQIYTFILKNDEKLLLAKFHPRQKVTCNIPASISAFSNLL